MPIRLKKFAMNFIPETNQLKKSILIKHLNLNNAYNLFSFWENSINRALQFSLKTDFSTHLRLTFS